MLTSFVTLYLFMLGDHNLCPKGFERQDDVCIARHVKSGGSCPPYTVYSDELKKCLHYHYHYRDMCQDGYRKENGICVVERSGVNCPPYTLYSDVLGKCIHIHEHPGVERDRVGTKKDGKTPNENHIERKHEDHTEQPHKEHDRVHIDHTIHDHDEHSGFEDRVHSNAVDRLHFGHAYDNHPRNIQHDRDFFDNPEFVKFW